MMVILLTIFGSVVAGILIERFVAVTAPLGYEDELGFHIGAERAGTKKIRRAGKSRMVRPGIRMQTGLPVGH